MNGKAKTAAEELTAREIGSNKGLSLILKKLDALFETDKNQRIFSELEAFEKFKRPSSMTMSSYILEFERLHTRVQHYECKYPEGVLAYKILQAANLSAEHEKLIKATINTGEWSYKSMKSQIKKIFSDITPVSNTPESSNKAIKVEPTFYANNSNECRDYIGEADGVYSDDEYNQRCAMDERNHGPDVENDIYYGRYQGNYRGNRPMHQGGRAFQQQQRNFNNNYVPRNQHQQGRKFVDINIKRLSDSYNSSPNVPNPKDDRGNFTTCRKCRSIFHWMKDCPHSASQENESSGSKVFYGNDTTEEVIIGLFQTSAPTSQDDLLCLVGETLDMAVIDSGCPKSVCGDKWCTSYIESMSEDQKANLKSVDSTAVFRFGNSPPMTSMKKIFLPVTIMDKEMYLPTEVVEADIPLLLSKETLKKGKAITNFEKETIHIYGSEQPMVCTTSGHYAIPIKPHSTEINTNIVMHVVKEGTDVKAVAKKLHQQFGHPSAHRLIKLVKDAGEENTELYKALEEVGTRCDTCKRYKKTPPRPIVTFPLATVFNETIAMDLKIYKNNSTYFLHVIDHATRFSAGSVIRSKTAEVTIRNFFKIWVSVFGVPQKVLSDNGGEFANNDFIDMCNNLGINFHTTAAEAPWSNGMVEKHNGLIGDAVSKIMHDVRCSVEIALCWALNAKNTLQNIHGFSPYQLVFGRNPNLPSVFTDKLPALEGVTKSQLVADQLNALHKARQEFIKSESAEKLRRALRGQTRTHSNMKYIQGEEVFYKRDDDKYWQGPGRVIGQDGSQVLIKIATGPIRVATCRVILTSEAEQNREVLEDNDNRNEIQDCDGVEGPVMSTEGVGGSVMSTEDVEGPAISTENNGNMCVEEVEEDSELIPPPELSHNESTSQPLEESHNAVSDEFSDSDNLQSPNKTEMQLDDSTLQVADTPVIPNSNFFDNVQASRRRISSTQELPRNNQCVEFKKLDSDEWRRGHIINRAGKSTGKHKFCLNIQNIDDNSEEAIDWKKDVKEWKVLNSNVFLASEKDYGYETAKDVELKKWKDMKVYEEVEDTGQNCVTVRWVPSEKMVEGKKIKKNRLVARGYEEDMYGIPTDSPTINKDSLRVAYVIIAAKEWDVNSMDVTAAFLQGTPLSREVYLKPPREAKAKGKLWKLKQCVYGLNDASRHFYLKIKEELMKAGCKCSYLDPAVFSYYDGDLKGLLMSHVDDFLWAGTEEFKTSVVDRIRNTFKISSESSTLFKYIGLDIQQCDTGIYLSQNKYTKDIQEIEVDASRLSDPNQPVNEEEKTALRSVIGQLNWLATQTRPDLSYDVCDLSTSLKDATVSMISRANRVIRKAKLQDVCLHFPKMNLDDLSFTCFADASLGNVDGGSSQGGTYIEVTSGTYHCPIDWQSKKIRRVAKSTLAAETIAMVEAIDSAIYLSTLLSEIVHNNKRRIPINCWTDSYSLLEAAHSTTSISDRRLRIETAIIREAIAEKKITLSWIDSKNQLADCMTKKGCDNRKLLARITN